MKKYVNLRNGVAIAICLASFSVVGCGKIKKNGEVHNPDGISQTSVAGNGYLNEVYYKDIPMYRILELDYENEDVSLESVLGKPLRNVVPMYSYDGMEIYSLSGFYVQVITGTNLSLFTINGVSLDKSITELVDLLDKPVSYEENYMMEYHVSTHVDYLIQFWFDNPDNIANNIRFAKLEQ